MFEVVGVGLLATGALLVLFGLAWLVLLAYRTKRWLGILLGLTIPLGIPLIYGLSRFQTAMRPLMLVVAGLLIGALPYGYDQVQDRLFGLAERERIVDGQRHLTLTGWDRPDYQILARKKDVVVLEMANSNVNDVTLELLKPLTLLKELTLSDTAVTDAGLATLKSLPALERLRLARTKITKEGLTEFLLSPPANLRELDVSGNSIPASVLRKWKNQDSENRKYVN